jgi:hypothetical protein
MDRGPNFEYIFVDFELWRVLSGLGVGLDLRPIHHCRLAGMEMLPITIYQKLLFVWIVDVCGR